MSHSPWGKIDHVEKLVTGVSFVSTPRHGGLRISKNALNYWAMNAELITRLGGITYGNYVFFEEDCAYALLLFDAPSLLKLDAEKRGLNADELFLQYKRLAETYFPDYFNLEVEK